MRETWSSIRCSRLEQASHFWRKRLPRKPTQLFLRYPRPRWFQNGREKAKSKKLTHTILSRCSHQSLIPKTRQEFVRFGSRKKAVHHLHRWDWFSLLQSIGRRKRFHATDQDGVFGANARHWNLTWRRPGSRRNKCSVGAGSSNEEAVCDTSLLLQQNFMRWREGLKNGSIFRYQRVRHGRRCWYCTWEIHPIESKTETLKSCPSVQKGSSCIFAAHLL